MRTQAQSIIDSNQTLDMCEPKAKETCLSVDYPDGWSAYYKFGDGSVLYRQFMSSASEEDSFIRALPIK